MRSIGLHKFNLPKATLVRKTYTIPEASDDDKLAEFGQNPAEFDDNDDIILLFLEMCLLHSQLVQLNWCFTADSEKLVLRVFFFFWVGCQEQSCDGIRVIPPSHQRAM